MKTLYKKIEDNREESNEAIGQAAEILKTGGLVAFPTETVYGLGANALSADAAAKIYAAKGRPSDNPLIVHICGKDMLYEITEDISEKARLLVDIFWPGPLTLVLKKKAVIPDVISGGLPTVAVRMPENNIALELIKAAGIPVAAPSANSSSKPSPTVAEHVLEDLNGKIDMIIDGGHTVYGLESTIVDVSGDSVRLLRPGSVTVDMLEEAIGEVEICTEAFGEGEKPPAPGMKYKHYAPKAELFIIKSKTRAQGAEHVKKMLLKTRVKYAVIATEEYRELYCGFDNTYYMGPEAQPDIIAENLFDILRSLDENKIEMAYAHGISESGIGHAIMNRLSKAAAYNIIDLS